MIFNRVAQEALVTAKETAGELRSFREARAEEIATFRAHIDECSRSNHERNTADLLWRAELGKRLDKQDRINLSALVTLVLILLSVTGYLADHLIRGTEHPVMTWPVPPAGRH